MFGEVERKMDLANKRGHEPEMFYTKGYSAEDLSQQDLINYGDILLLDKKRAILQHHIIINNLFDI